MDNAIKSTLDEARKIEEQISAILAALVKDESIKEAILLELPSSESQNKYSSRQKKSWEEMDTEIGLSKCKDIYKLAESSLFLLPVLDEWVFGMTLSNVSKLSQNYPELVLNLQPHHRRDLVVDKPCQVFHYRVQVHPLDVEYEADMENRNLIIGDNIPYHDTFQPTNKKKMQIQPGCQVLTTANFQYPINFLDNNNKLNLIISLMLNGTELWSRIIPVILDNLTVLQQSENTFRLHQSSILMAMGKHREYFKLNRLLSHGDKSLHKAVEKFLVPLGFEKVSDDSPLGIDRVVDIFASTKHHLSPLWGTVFKLEKCTRNVNTVNCILSARSTQQYQMFMRLFQSWLKKEGREERNKGMTGLSVLPMILPAEDKNVIKTIQDEINVINKLVDVRQKNRTKTGPSGNKDSAWIKEFIQVLGSTDDVFMNHLCFS